MDFPRLPWQACVLAGSGALHAAVDSRPRHHRPEVRDALRHDLGVEITLVSRDNYFLMSPFLFEAGSGVLERRHSVNPIRPMFGKVRFVEPDIDRVDFDQRIVYARHAPADRAYALHYDQVRCWRGGGDESRLIPGSEHAFGFQTLSDAIFVRNTMIDLFEQADVEEDPAVRRRLLTFVIIGGGLVGTELIGELTSYTQPGGELSADSGAEVHSLCADRAHYTARSRWTDLAEYAADRLWNRGVSLILGDARRED